MPWVEMNVLSPVPFIRSIKDDIRAHVDPRERPSARIRWLPIAAKVALSSPGFRAVLNYRIAHLCVSSFGSVGKPVSRLCFWVGRHWYGCALAPTARLYGGLILPHPQGIVVGAGAVVGPQSWIFQNVTLGGSAGKAGMPKVGSGARIYSGAVVVGPVVLGDQVVVGANAVVTQSAPDRATVRASRGEVLVRDSVED